MFSKWGEKYGFLKGKLFSLSFSENLIVGTEFSLHNFFAQSISKLPILAFNCGEIAVTTPDIFG